MPTGASVSGTVTRVAAGGSAATGTLSRIGYSTNGAEGTLEIDRTLFLAFYSRVRLTRPDVYIDDELMANLVDTVTLEESLDDPIGYASFTLSDPRVAFFDAASLSDGEHDVEIDFWAGPPGAVLKWDAFVGSTESSQNTMPYRPRGTFRAASLSAKWADRKGCLNIPAFSGFTRGQILAAFAESAGVVIANAAELGGGIVNRPVDIAGKTPFDLIRDYGEVEGWLARTTDDGSGLEIISEDQALGGEPIFIFDEGNTFDVPEATPTRPVTDWVLSATEVVVSPPGSSSYETTVTDVPVVDGDGNPLSNTITTVTVQEGTEIRRVTERWELIITPGYQVVPALYQIVERVTVETTWTPFAYVDPNGFARTRPSTLMASRKTTTEVLGGVLTRSSNGFTWTNGGQYLGAYASLTLSTIVDETFEWDSATCFQTSAVIVTQGYYDPLSVGGFAYNDGTERLNGTYTFMEISRDTTAWRTSSIYPYPVELSVSRREWWAQTPGDETYTDHTTSTTASVLGVGSVTTPPSGSADIPSFQQRVIMAEVDATDASGYAKRTESPGALDYAESIADLETIAKRRIRRDCSDTLAIPHNCIPFLRVGDHVAVTNHARNLVLADAYVYSISRTANVTNGGMRQVTTVKIPPDWI
jgi:hypothetical protein